MKRMSWIVGAVVVGASLVVGCSETKSEPKGSLTVQGSVSSRLSTDNARAVAIGANGKQVWTYLDKKGDFSLKLPVGQSYRILIANQRPGKGQSVIGRLTLPSGAGKSRWIGANETGTVNLGVLRDASAAPTTTGNIAPKCFCGEDGDGYADEGAKGTGEDKGTADKGGWGDDEGTADKGGNDKGTADKGGWGDDEGTAGKDGKGGWGEEDESDHGDDNECFEGKGKKSWDEDMEDGEDKDLGGLGEEDEEICEPCSEGDVKDLEPSKKPDPSKFEDKDNNAEDGDFIEKKACGKKVVVKDPGAVSKDPGTKDVGKDVGDKVPADKGTAEKVPSKGDEGDDAVSSKIAFSKKLGDKCSVKSECSSDCSCIAAKCQVK